jgi:hypothetical protein
LKDGKNVGNMGKNVAKHMGIGQNLRRITKKKGNSGKTYVTIPGEIWCGKFGEI